MITTITYHDVAVFLVNDDTTRGGKLPISFSLGPEFEQELACLVKYLHSMVVAISNYDFAS